jgi:hypothetical protein
MKLEGLSLDKETYTKVENIELRKKALYKALYVLKIAGLDEQIGVLRQQKSKLMLEREELI